MLWSAGLTKRLSAWLDSRPHFLKPLITTFAQTNEWIDNLWLVKGIEAARQALWVATVTETEDVWTQEASTPNGVDPSHSGNLYKKDEFFDVLSSDLTEKLQMGEQPSRPKFSEQRQASCTTPSTPNPRSAPVQILLHTAVDCGCCERNCWCVFGLDFKKAL